ncbi:N-6 DNA methylase [Xanthomonas campestris]|uniref:N-6 DNA methylase n=1 Tax=Xanthomonas TaxID=338 RepID=UPI0011C03A5E|nr:N-6 DNA methylase [Xanthomonas campestris]MCC5091049.1 N-6 DNA methylase [Xanthomonas campestris]
MNEENVKIHKLLPLLESKGYKRNCMDFEVAVEVHEGRKKKTIFADVLVYSSARKTSPLLLCETKASTEVLDRNAREQAISYARLLPKIAPLVLVTNGDQSRVYLTLEKTQLPELPSRNELRDDLIKFVISSDTQDALRQEAKHELFIIDDVQAFKHILKACHNEIRNNEGMDPTAAFDEMSKLMFCKLYEEKSNPKSNRFRLSVFDDCIERLHFNVVHKILEEAKSALNYKDVLSNDTKILLKDRTIRKIVELFENYDLGLTAFDVKGEAFEYFLGDTFTGGLGEYFTPRNVVEFMVDAVAPRIGEKIIDPFCGTGGFLIFAFDTVSEKIRLNDFAEEERNRWRLELSEKCLFGIDWKERIAQACKMNMTVHGDGSSGIFRADGLQDVPGAVEPGMFDVCLTNPPFGSIENDPVVLANYELASGRKSQDRLILGIERCIKLLKPGGRMGIVVIDGILNNRSTQSVRSFIRTHSIVEGVVSLGRNTFLSYGAAAKTSIVFLRKKKACGEMQGPSFFAIAGNTGLAGNGQSIPGNELPDVLIDFKEFVKNGSLTNPRSRSWISTPTDRMDAEAYAPSSLGASVLGESREELRDANEKAKSAYEATLDIEQVVASAEYDDVLLDSILEEVKDRVKVSAEESYALLGVKWWGEGAFVREQKIGKALKGHIYRVKQGMLIYNRLFAFRGSFALTEKEHDSACASIEFPTFIAKPGVKDAAMKLRYIVQVLNSPGTLEIVDRLSTGSTKQSRNRFGQAQLLSLTVRIPSRSEELEQITEAMESATAVRRAQAEALEAAKSFKNQLSAGLPSAQLKQPVPFS